MIVLPSLRGVELFAVFDVFILGVVKQEVFHAEPLRELAGVLYRRVVLFVGLERAGLRMEAEGFVQQPLASLGVPALAFVVGLVAAAGELFAGAQVHAEAVLLRLRRKYIEEGEFPANYLALYSDASYEGGLLRAEQLARHVVYKSDDLVVRVDARLAVVCAAAHVLAYHARHPDYAEQVVDVLVRHEYVAYILPVCSGLLQPAQHRIAKIRPIDKTQLTGFIKAPETEPLKVEGFANIIPEKIPGNIIKIVEDNGIFLTAVNGAGLDREIAGEGGLGVYDGAPSLFFSMKEKEIELPAETQSITFTFKNEVFKNAAVRMEEWMIIVCIPVVAGDNLIIGKIDQVLIK